MAVFLSPGVFTREIDLSVLPAGVGALTPAFIGTANKGPINDATFVTSAQQAIDTFGEPFPESFLMYAVLAYFEEGGRAWVLRVGVECDDTLDEELEDICIDTSGAREDGWGRISVFQGIANGEICTREITSDNPIVIHDSAILGIDYTDADISSTFGPASATLLFSGTGLSDAYTEGTDECFTVLITSDVTSGTVDGAGYQVIQNSDGEVLSEGTLTESGTPGESDPIDIGSGLIFAIVVSGSAPIAENDSFTFCAQPDNTAFAFDVNFTDATGGSGASTFDMTLGTFSSADDFADAINLVIGSSEDYLAVAKDDDTVCFTTRTAGEGIQLLDSEGFALEVGQTLFTFDIPRGSLLGVDSGPFIISSSNNRIAIRVIEPEGTTDLEFTIGTGSGLDATSVAAFLNPNGITAGDRFFRSFAVTAPGGDSFVLIEVDVDHQFGTLQILADTSHIKTLRFAEELGIQTFVSNPESFFDSRVVLPDPGTTTLSTPLSCESDPFSSECASDSDYFGNIVGWFIAKSPGTWIDDFVMSLGTETDALAGGDAAGIFAISIFDLNGNEVDRISEVTFDSRDDRYIGNVINEGSSIGGTNGNSFVQWEARPSFLDNDPDDTATFEVRTPAAFNSRSFSGSANGIPTDAEFSSELDKAVIGRPDLETGIFAFQNPEVFDISLLLTPGFSSGSVIGNSLQMVEGRGDVLYIVDPPFGLRAQQVVDWHNGMLFSDLSQAINSSYGALYFPHLRIFDQFNNTEIFVPPSGHVSSVFARTSAVAEQWFAPAGLRRGRLLTPLDVEIDLNMGERDLLYGFGNAVNPIVNFPQDGITVFGQRTLQRTSSALDRVNVRMLLNFIKKNSVILLRNFLFEPNDSTTRAQVQTSMNTFLADIQARRGLVGFRVVSDETNNTPERIDRNELHVAVFLKPTRAIEFIVLNLVVLRSEQSFAADEVLAAGGIVT